MTKPPKPHRTSQTDYVQSAVRFPKELRTELQEAAERNGRSLNAEILARLQGGQIDHVLSELAEVKAMLRKVLDQM